MANISNGSLSIYLDKDSELNKIAVDEIINNLENNNHFTYCGLDGFNAIFHEEAREIDLSFTGRSSCDSCWEWIENEISDGQNNVELSLEARTLLLNSEISGGSYEYGTHHRDRVEKKNGAKKFERYQHTKLDSEWPEVLGIIGAYNLNQGDSQVFGEGIEITLLEKSEAEEYLFEIVGDEGITILIDKKSEQVAYFSETDSMWEGFESINEILEGLDNGDLKQVLEPNEWYCNQELIDDLIGQKDDCFELSKTF